MGVLSSRHREAEMIKACVRGGCHRVCLLRGHRGTGDPHRDPEGGAR